MANQPITKPASQTSTLALVVCDVCKQTGRHGAEWLVHIVGQVSPVKVHKPCGETLIRQAPEVVKAKLVPSRELRAVWDRQRAEKSARSFWDSKFAQAKPISKPPVVLAAPAETAQVA